MNIQIIGEKTGSHPVFSYYQFNEGKHAFIKLKAQKLFEMFKFFGVTLDEIVAWFYGEGYTPDVTGITYKYSNEDPDWFYIYINHFSKIVLGTIKNPTNIKQSIPIPNEYNLEQNYPNPFNPETKINYSLPANGEVKLTVYTLQGELIKTLVNERQNAGSYSVEFDGSDLVSGMYIYKLTVNNFVQIKKMLLAK